MHEFFFISIFFVESIAIAYFVVQEWRWGTTIGKWLLGMRVISERNQPPALLPATMRAVLVPGLSYLGSTVPGYLLEFDPSNYDNMVVAWIIMMLVQMLSWIPSLLCFITARKENGYLGFHDRISGSRVVRLAGALEYKRPRNVPVTSPVALENTITMGEFVAVGRLGLRPDSGSEVLLARDTSLDRDVWIVSNAANQPTLDWENRKAVSRPTRLRILAEHNDPDQPRWVATEAIKGIPLINYIRQTPDIDWRSFRPLLRELVYELAKGEEDRTLPQRLSERSVWLDQTGRTKLLDQPIRPPVNVERSDQQIENEQSLHQPDFQQASPNQENEWLGPFELVTLLLDAFIEEQVVPAHVLTFRKELDVFRTQPESLTQAGKRLGSLADEPSAWRWDDRLGVLAISSGLEFSTVVSFGMVLGLVCTYFFQMPQWYSGLTILLMGTIAAVALGIVLGGGPAFRLSGVLLRKNKTLEPASNARCAFRTWISWFPLIVATSAITIGFNQQLIAETQTGGTEAAYVDPTFTVVSVLLFIGVLMMTFFAAAYSILRPSRGIADLIAGTRLIRK